MFKLLLLAAIVATASAGCREVAATNTFHYFYTGSASGCEHRHHYLYDYAGSDCVWESSPTVINQRNRYDFHWMRAKFHVAEYGSMEYSDYVEVRLSACTSSSSRSCGSYATTKLLRDDFGGWYWQIKEGNWLSQLNPNHSHIRVKVTMHNSGSRYNAERHILDNLEIIGYACDKVVTASPTSYPTAFPTKNPTKNPTANPTSYPTAYPTAFPTSFPTAYPTGYPTAFPTAYPTGYPTAFPTSFPTSYPTPQCSTTCSWVKNHHIQVTHDRTLIAHNKKYNGAHYAQHKCYHDGTTCHCECHGTNWKGHGNTMDKTSLANCKNTKIAGTFSKFNTGTATGCEHRTHYLYEYRGTDCVWTSNYNKFAHPHNFDGAMVKFQMAEYGSLESDDHVLIELRFCGKGKNYGKTSGMGNYDCTPFKPTVKIANDLLGWVWTTVTGANRDAFFSVRFGRYRVTSSNWKNYKLNMEPHQQWVQIKITLKSSDNYREQHILDNMEVWGGCQ